MPTYRFISKNGELHEMEIELPDDEAAKEEAKQAFAEAVSDAALNANEMEITMRLEREGRALFSAAMHLTCHEGEP